jgi:hypothetical protein
VAEKIEVSPREYFSELGRLGAKTRRRGRLTSEYFRKLAYIRWRPEQRGKILEEARRIREEMRRLDVEIEEERRKIALKIVTIPPVKIPPPPPPPRNKLLAMHKRWFYESPRGRHHDISIEAVASMIIPGTERREDYEDELRSFLEDEMSKTPGFERLTELGEEVVGFEERPTDMPARGPRLETLEWWHRITPVQLSIEKFLVE